MSSFSKNVALLLLGFWLGCSIFFVAVVAPTLFQKQEAHEEEPHPGIVSGGLSTEMAGAISGSILRRIYLITYVAVGTATFFLLLASFGDAKWAKGPRRALVFCILVLGLNAANDLWIHDRINKIKLQMTNPDGSRKESFQQQFKQWHEASRWVYGAATLSGLLGAILLLPSVAGAKSKKSSK